MARKRIVSGAGVVAASIRNPALGKAIEAAMCEASLAALQAGKDPQGQREAMLAAREAVKAALA